MAAALALGDGAVLSHRSAAELWRLLPPRDGPVNISIRGRAGRKRRQGIRVHRCQSLQPAYISRHRGIPVTTVARTIADLRSAASAREQRRALRQAAILGLPTGSEEARDRTRSELEFEFLRLCARHGLPAPEVNVRIGGRLVDFLWRSNRLVVETDGYQYHRGRVAFKDDHSRNLELLAQGYEVVRLSYEQVFHESARVAVGLRDRLSV
jgi:hypothetical protein